MFVRQAMDFPGGKVGFSPEMRFISGSPQERVHCYRVLDDNGNIISGSDYVQVYLARSNPVPRHLGVQVFLCTLEKL